MHHCECTVLGQLNLRTLDQLRQGVLLQGAAESLVFFHQQLRQLFLIEPWIIEREEYRNGKTCETASGEADAVSPSNCC